MDLIYFILCALGLTNILTISKILSPIRPKHYFFHCPMCMGFWTGVFLWAVNVYTELFTFDYNFINPLLLGCLSSGTSYVLGRLFGDEGLRIEFFKVKPKNVWDYDEED